MYIACASPPLIYRFRLSRWTCTNTRAFITFYNQSNNLNTIVKRSPACPQSFSQASVKGCTTLEEQCRITEGRRERLKKYRGLATGIANMLRKVRTRTLSSRWDAAVAAFKLSKSFFRRILIIFTRIYFLCFFAFWRLRC